MMRWLLFLLIVLGALLYFRNAEDVPHKNVEDTFIGGPVKALHKAEGFEDSYLKKTEAHKKQLEDQLEKAAGG